MYVCVALPESDGRHIVRFAIRSKVEDRFGEMFRLRKPVDPVFRDIMQPVDLVVTDEEQFRRCESTPSTLAFEAATEGRAYE